LSRILVDTNVFVSALVFGGKPTLVLQAVEAFGIELVISDELESELSDTLTGKFGWTLGRVNEVRQRLLRDAYRVTPTPLTGIVRDQGDDHVLAAAIAAKASLIVTGDKDLLALDSFQGIRIVTPAMFIQATRP
jgi:putative PIN family toxin of toxin-antitoxin system